MIPLLIRADVQDKTEPFVVRLNADYGLRSSEFDAYLVAAEDRRAIFQDDLGATIVLYDLDPFLSDGDVMLVVPEQQTGHRLIRAHSTDNTLLFTERCDQRCVMCSQPPKQTHHDITLLLELAVKLAPLNMTLGISGGESTLYKTELFAFILRVLEVRNDITFHILSNGQHFAAEDLDTLRSLPRGNVTWGIPIYAADAETHDEIVQKPGAFKILCSGLELLCRSGAAIELRTVLMTKNVERLGALSQFITTHTPFAVHWAIMQMENIGFAEAKWSELFVDTSCEFSAIEEATGLVRARGIPVFLYNFPLCTMPATYRVLAPSTISDWKRRYLPICARCSASQVCCGFFEWYPEVGGFSKVHPI